MELAVLILTRDRVHLLRECLESIKAQQSHPFAIKFYLLVNGKDHQTQRYLEQSEIGFDVVDEPMPVGEARNLLIDRVREKYICFLDDDISLPTDYFQKAAKFIESTPEVDIFGGPDQNPSESTNFQKCLSLVMESYLANGPTNKRHKTSGSVPEEGDEINLILCNFWAKTKVFEIQKFPKNFRRNEENYLLSILKDNGVSMARIPSLYVFHNRKVSLAKLARVLFLAGLYRMVSIINYPKSAKPIFFLHQLLLIVLIWSLLSNLKVAGILICAYLAIIGVASLRIAVSTRNPVNLPLGMILFIVFNFVYPVGQFAGYFKGIGYRLRGQAF